MIRTQVQPKGENSSTFRGVTRYMEELMGKNQAEESDTETRDEFSKLMDKIAARFSENLGFDYTNLLGQIPVQQQVKENPKASKKLDKGNSEKEEAQATGEVKSTSEFHAEVKARTRSDKKEDKNEAASKETKEEKEVKKAGENNSEKSQDKKNVTAKEEGNKEEVKVRKSDKTSEEVPVKTADSKEVKAEENTEETKEVKEVKAKSDKFNKSEKKEAKDNAGQEEKTEAVEIGAANSEAVKTPEHTEVSAEVKAKEASAKEAAPLNTQSNSSILASLMLSSAFTSKDIVSSQSQAANNTQNVQSISDIVKDKIVASMNNAVGSQNSSNSMSGGFSLKASTEKAQNLKEKNLLQQPQMFKAFEKVESALKEAAKAKDGKTISLRLDPPSLGTVKIDVSMREGGLHARINADNNTISSLLREHSQDLQQALRKLGISVDRVTVSITEGFQTDVGQSGGENFQNDQNASQANQTSEEGFLAGVEVSGSENAQKSESSTLDHWVA